jgi:cell division protein FtsB
MAVRAASAARPRGLNTRPAVPGRFAPAGAGVRWDRLGRLALLFVLAALAYLYLSAGVHMLSKYFQDRRVRAAVVTLRREHAALVRTHEALARQSTLEAEARRLGMIKPGEQPFIASGLPNN